MIEFKLVCRLNLLNLDCSVVRVYILYGRQSRISFDEDHAAREVEPFNNL